MAQDYPDMDITLIGPTEYINLDWGKPIVLKVGKNQNERFQFIPLRFVNNKLWRGGYFAKGLGKILKKIKPDLIYLIGTETDDLTLYVTWIRRFFLPKTKIAFFTMRGTNMPMNNPNFRLRWNYISKVVDAYFCHCPRTVEILRIQGKIWQPIYMQTQVGVPDHIFKPDEEKRKRIREKYGIKDSEYLFGSVSRMDIRKGLIDMLDALPVKANWKFIMIGSGPDQKLVEDTVRRKGLEDKVLLPGKFE